MIANGVSRRGNLVDELRIFLRRFAEHEECRARPVRLQNRQKPGRDDGMRSIVECDGRHGVPRQHICDRSNAHSARLRPSRRNVFSLYPSRTQASSGRRMPGMVYR